MILPGVFINNADKPYEVETNYYLKFYTKSALVSLKMIGNPNTEVISLFDSKAQYYHYYTDHLLYAIGQIAERFRIDGRQTQENKKYYNRRECNRKNYKFDEQSYPLLSNKIFRNTIEHIDEYDINTIIDHKFVGGFNYIDEDTPEDLVDALKTNQDNHIYTLNILKKELNIIRNGKSLILNFDLLLVELNSLMKNVKIISGFLG